MEIVKCYIIPIHGQIVFNLYSHTANCLNAATLSSWFYHILDSFMYISSGSEEVLSSLASPSVKAVQAGSVCLSFRVCTIKSLLYRV